MSAATGSYVMPTPLSAGKMVDALRHARISHLVIVPDTWQKTFLAAAAAAKDIACIQACTEDEAVAINAGLYAAGHRPMMTIQNNGLFACVNTIRGIALDASVPTVMLIGQYGQKREQPAEESPQRMVRLLGPTLATWDVPTRWLMSDADLDAIPADYDAALTRRGPAALIVPIPTA